MARKKVGARRADGSVIGAKIMTNKPGELGDRGRGGKILTFAHAGELDCLAAITAEWQANGQVPWTLRHYYYVVKNLGLVKPVKGLPAPYHNSEENAYGWVGALMANAREGMFWGRDSWRVQNDPGTRRGHYWHSGDLRAHVRHLAAQQQYYDANLWAGQQRRVVILTEKDGLYGALESYGDPYGVAVVAAVGGFGSVSTKYEVAQELIDIANEGQDTTILYVGDHDASGLAIERDFGDTLRRYGYCGDMPERVAVTKAQALAAPVASRQPIEGQNVNNARYLRDTGLDFGVQVEAIPGQDLKAMVEAAIETHMDLGALADADAVSSAVSNWLTRRFSAIITDYEDDVEPLDVTIRRAGELTDPRTRQPLSPSLVARYLPSDDDDDRDRDDDDDDL